MALFGKAQDVVSVRGQQFQVPPGMSPSERSQFVKDIATNIDSGGTGISPTPALEQINQRGAVPFQFQRDTLTGDTAKLLGQVDVRRESDPFQQRFGERALQTFGQVNPNALLPVANDVRALENALQFRQNQARGLGEESRQAQSGALAQLLRRAQGQDSVVAEQTKAAQDRMRRSVASQLASQRGNFNPAAQRAALMSLSQGNVDLGAQSAAAMAEERQQALNSLAGLQTQQRQQDMFGLGLEGQLAGQSAALVGQRAQLLDAINRNRAAFANQVFGRGDLASQEALNAARIIQGVPQQQQGPGFLQTLGGLGGLAAGIGALF